MAIKSDIQIAQESKMRPIADIAKKLKIKEEHLEPYGHYKAKISLDTLAENKQKEGKLILVSAITPTPAGEGKTTTTVGLGDALCRLGKKAVITLREPSLGPVFGIKGGAAGGGYAQVVPMEDINLHFTGDMHAITAANNLLAALIDNHIQQGNTLDIDVKRITWKRCVDMNDRQLRYVINGLGGKVNGVPREDGFDITVASEVMAILCLATSLKNLKERLEKIIIGYNRSDAPVYAKDLGAAGAMAALLKEAIKPNLVQTLENNPAIIHGGPFANIAHGCNSVLATKTALALGDYVITEAGFGADLGAEKFLDIKCRAAGLTPAAAVLVATIRALKFHGGCEKTELTTENCAALEHGIENLYRHYDNLHKTFGLPVVVAINRFPTDTEEEINTLKNLCKKRNIPVELCEVWADGGKGGEAVAKTLLSIMETEENSYAPAYDTHLPVAEKIKAIVQKIYGGTDIALLPAAKAEIKKIEDLGYGSLPICMAKTQYSFSDNAALRCAPSGFTVTIKSIRLALGAGFIVAQSGDIMTMPGLPKVPSAEKIDVDEKGNISGLF